MTQDETLTIGLERGLAISEQAQGRPGKAEQVDGAGQVEYGKEHISADVVGALEDHDHGFSNCREHDEGKHKRDNQPSALWMDTKFWHWLSGFLYGPLTRWHECILSCWLLLIF